MAQRKKMLEEAQKAISDYINLSKFLFGDDAPLDVNQIPKDNPFYEDVKAISDEMGLDWEKMTHEESNRVMLNVLADYFCRVQENKDCEPVLTISFKKE